MVAVEGRRGGPTGDLWNEAPDRVADAAIFIGAGYAAGSCPLLGFTAALLAVFVAYVRALGASVGAGQIFIGPMAKPHRMAALTGLAVIAAIFPAAISHRIVTNLPVAITPVSVVLALIIVGCVVTALRRLSRIAAFLRTKTS
jgi:phosphatidylglycerophosphate synthase